MPGTVYFLFFSPPQKKFGDVHVNKWHLFAKLFLTDYTNYLIQGVGMVEYNYVQQ